MKNSPDPRIVFTNYGGNHHITPWFWLAMSGEQVPDDVMIIQFS